MNRARQGFRGFFFHFFYFFLLKQVVAGEILAYPPTPEDARKVHLGGYNNRRPHRSLGMKTPAEFARMIDGAA